MITATTFDGKTVALFGLGGSGLATAHALIEGGANVLAWDDNPESVAKASAEGADIADLHRSDWSGFSSLVLAPGVPLTHPRPHWSVEMARSKGVEIIGDVEIFSRERAARAPAAPFIAITGTNGKSTTTALTAHVLGSAGRDAQMGGNIGRAVLTLEPLGNDRHYVVECSSYQVDLAPSLTPSAGVLLNLSPDHLDRHGSMENYAAIKERLASGSDTAIVGIDDDHCSAVADRLENTGKKVVRISVTGKPENGFYADGAELFKVVGGKTQRVASLEGIGSLRGRHNAQNALAALAACLDCGLTAEEIQAGFASFPGLAHRMEQVAHRGHVVFINDSKATNAEAAAPALSSFDRIYWIAGGLAKEGGIDALKPLFPRIAKAYLVGEAAPAFAATLGDTVPFEISGTIGAAVAHAARDAAADSADEAAVLLSPACASFDQFRNFEMRGEAFRTAVQALDDVQIFARVG